MGWNTGFSLVADLMCGMVPKMFGMLTKMCGMVPKILGMVKKNVRYGAKKVQHGAKKVGVRITRAINKRREIENKHWKYVDDLTIAEAVDLKTKLKLDEENTLVKPLTYHERTQHILPPENSKVQQQLNEIVLYAEEN